LAGAPSKAGTNKGGQTGEPIIILLKVMIRAWYDQLDPGAEALLQTSWFQRTDASFAILHQNAVGRIPAKASAKSAGKANAITVVVHREVHTESAPFAKFKVNDPAQNPTNATKMADGLYPTVRVLSINWWATSQRSERIAPKVRRKSFSRHFQLVLPAL